MAQCAVYVYDSTLAALSSSSTIDILELDDSGKNLDYQLGKTLTATEFGAKITLPAVHQPIDVLVDDTSRVLGPASLCQLNSKLTARLDVVLYALPVAPAGGGGGGIHPWVPHDPYSQVGAPHDIVGGSQIVFAGGDLVQTPAAIASFINQQITDQRWSKEEAEGVRSLVETTMRFLNKSHPRAHLRAKLVTWVDLLKSLGIDVSHEVKKKQKRGGSSSPQSDRQIKRGEMLEAES